MARPMANDPPFATLNHFTGDLGIPSESDSLRIGISPTTHSLYSLAAPEPCADDRTGAMDDIERALSRRAIAAAIAGNVLEWYDFVVYSYFATTLARTLFPPGDEAAALLDTFAAFGIGFIARPVGAIVIGWLGDRSGRKAALILTLTMMAGGTMLLGLVPSYATI